MTTISAVATEKEANLAREQHSDSLRDLGAHAITIDEVTRGGVKTFAVIAMFEKKPKTAPKTLAVKKAKGTLDVPLVTRVSEKYRPE